jgi:hypothetical protein
LLHRHVSLLSSTEEVKESPGDTEFQSQSKGELLISNDFDELSLVENSCDSEENGMLDDSAILYDEMEVDGNESVWKADSDGDKIDNTDNMGQTSVRKSKNEYHHVTRMLVPHEGCSQDSGTGIQEMVKLYHSQERDSSVVDQDLIINKPEMLTRRDLSRDPLIKCQKFEEDTKCPIPSSLKYSSRKLPCQIEQEKVDFLYLLGEESDHHVIVKVILSYLEPLDLTTVAVVSTTWNRVCKSDSAACRRVRQYLKQKRQNKENDVLQVCRECLARQCLYCIQSYILLSYITDERVTSTAAHRTDWYSSNALNFCSRGAQFESHLGCWIS